MSYLADEVAARLEDMDAADEIERLRARCAELEKALRRASETLDCAGYRTTDMKNEIKRIDADLAILVGTHTGTPPKREINSTTEILQRLADGDRIVFSEDGDNAWFVDGDRAFIGSVIIEMRRKGYLKRVCEDEENYRGSGEYDTISEEGRATLHQGQDNG